jgi:hypothetical protein
VGYITVIGSEVFASYNTGQVDGNNNNNTGGVAGNVTDGSRIIACYNSGHVIKGGDNTGGVAGQIDHGTTIQASYNLGDVSGTRYTGGVVGHSTYSPDNGDEWVKACYNAGLVSATSSDEGGVLGGCDTLSQIMLTYCYWDSILSSTTNSIGNDGTNNSIGSTPGVAVSFTTNVFPNVKSSAVPGWETGNGSNDNYNTGKYWKAGTTNGGLPPRLWWE